MERNIIVTAKQVIDPETPASAMHINPQRKTMETPPNVPPVINGYDENAIEAALLIKEATGCTVSVISAGTNFAMDVMKKTLAMGCDELILVEDELLEGIDACGTAQILAAAIQKIGTYDLVLCGRQASDFDQAQVPVGIAEFLGVPCVTLARRVELNDKSVVVDRLIPDGHDTLMVPTPAVVSVSNELGQPRYPTLRGIMSASKKQPQVWRLADLEVSSADINPKIETLEIFVPAQNRECEFIDAETEEEMGRNLALRLREEKLI
ncbi:electron transfer flavoprotein subunit beta/FixA family protein [SAR202 cluster bacterium AD-802-E10_MRT_200m]|nr:electron transfer flavoprotein subunit beta/FixA family protein [SAR202 cluster bacterium AD-802-E10_MRT_200m]